MNTLYEFEVNKEVTKKHEEKSKNDEGEEITITKDVTEFVPVTFAIQKPNRKLYESGELHYGVRLSEGIKAGLLTRALLAKRYKDDGGPMSEPEKKRYAELYYQLAYQQDQLEKLKLNIDKKDEDTRNKLAGEIMAEITFLQEELQEYELAQSSLFDQTAEKRAQNQTIMWWVLHLAHQKSEDGNYTPVFGAGELSFDEMLDKYDEIEERSEPFWTEVIKKYAYFITFWYTNGLSDQSQFEEIEKMYKLENGIDLEELENEESSEEAKAEESETEKTKADAKEKPKKKTRKTKKKAEAKSEEVEVKEPEAEKPKDEETLAEPAEA